MKLFVSKDCSGIEIVKKKFQCCGCNKDILQGERCWKYKITGKTKIKCLNCRQEILNSL